MQRHIIAPRPDWRRRVEDLGLLWHTDENTPYWSEDAFYSFSGDEISVIEQVSEELARLFLAAGQQVIDQRLFADFGIPDWCVPLIQDAWERELPALNHGRFDLGMGVDGQLKLFEFNCDTPTSLVESALVQWFWKEDVFVTHDQFNRVHEALIDRWRAIAPALPEGPVHFAHVPDRLGEDTLTTAYMMDLAREAGLDVRRITMADIGWKDGSDGGFFDLEPYPITALYKLYPWEWLVAEPFGRHIAEDPRATCWIEPIWKMIWSNKAILPVLWQLFPDHPNLLWAGRLPPTANSYVSKPLLGREGSNITIIRDWSTLATSTGPYTGPVVYQGFCDVLSFDGHYPVIGSWMVDGEAVGMGVREGGRITTNRDRFTPHVIE